MNFRDFRGIEKVKIAVLKTDTKEELTYDTPIDFAGIESLGQELEESTGTRFYDNQAAIVTDAEGADKYKIVTSVLEGKVRATVEGRKYDEENNAFFGTPKEKPYIAIGFIAKDTNGDKWFYWVYKNKITGGGETHNTEDDGTETTNLEWEASSIYTQHTFTKAGNKPLKYYCIKESEKVTEEKFFKTVFNPDTVEEAMVKEKKGVKTEKEDKEK
ncbi:MAG: hypothetical protein Q4B89_01025 [Lachnospiraceae bacterium]|nr:hypothetical protein [Lachnospiraceae bacterium]